MEDWKKDARREPVITVLDALVPQDHILRKIEKVMDYDWLYERLSPYYCHDNGRPGADPVVLKYAAMNLKKIAIWSCKFPSPSAFVALFMPLYARTPILAF